MKDLLSLETGIVYCDGTARLANIWPVKFCSLSIVSFIYIVIMVMDAVFIRSDKHLVVEYRQEYNCATEK